MLDALQFSDVVVTADQLFDLTLLATGSREQAEKAAKAYRHAELRSGQVPAG